MCRIEPYAPEHQDGIVAVVRAVHEEYGFTWEADGYHRDLYDIGAFYTQQGGMFWSLLAEGRVIGCAGVLVHGRECELHRMYLLPAYRGRGLGRLLLETSMDFGRRQGCRRMQAWSDVKLTQAHKLYRKAGFVQEGERICDDPDNAREYGFWREPL
ncbi:MAG: GNAT family N-acetyltransferase [Phycisphaerae bacterium]|nr:GNAT family N-acetyltransferase [Phycisphaerae bacterium]